MDVGLSISFRRATNSIVLLGRGAVLGLFSMLSLIVVGHVVRVLLKILPFIVCYFVVVLCFPSLWSRSSDSDAF